LHVHSGSEADTTTANAGPPPPECHLGYERMPERTGAASGAGAKHQSRCNKMAMVTLWRPSRSILVEIHQSLAEWPNLLGSRSN